VAATGIVAAAAIWRFLPLFDPIREIASGRLDFFQSALLPIALEHAAALFAVWLVARRHGWPVVLFGAVSLLLVVTLGGFVSVLTGAEVALYAVAAAGAGRLVTRAVLSSRDRRWPVNLGLGIVMISIAGSVLGTVGAFRGWALAAAMAGAAAFGFRRSRSAPFRRSMRARWRFLDRPWPLARVVALESLTLLAAFTWIAASPPEQRSDGLRLYLPFIKYLAHFHRLPPMATPWAFVIPEAGPAYSATLLALFGDRSLRYAMPLCLLALGGIVSNAGKGRYGRPMGCAIAVAVASIPIILMTSMSVMNEAFVSLCVVLFAWIAVRSKRADLTASALLIGAIGGVAIGAKYTTLVYLAPLGVWALVRAARNGVRRLILLAAGALAGAAASFSPWMWHASRVVGNPFFPFLSRSIPTRIYPHGLGAANLGKFRLSPGWVSWLRAPFDLTYFTSRYLENFSGNLGLAFLGALLLSVVLLFSSRRRAIAPFVVAASVGAILLWSQTAYVRYWLPSVWLLALAGSDGLSRVVRRGSVALTTTLVAALVLFVQIPVAMSQSWVDPVGFPLDYYAGTVSDDQFIGRLNGGAALLGFSRTAPPWPGLIETSLDGCSTVDAICMEVDYWHLRALLDIHDVPQMSAFARGTGASYWAVDWTSNAAEAFRKFGLEKGPWRPEALVYASGSVRVFRVDGGAAKPFPTRTLVR